jgi:hypothetical protein
MPKYVIERDIPGAGKLTPAELHGISQRSCTIIDRLGYITLGVILLNASRNPLAHRSLIWFTVWSSIVHAGVMAVQSMPAAHSGHRHGDVPALFLAGIVLGGLLVWSDNRRAKPLGASGTR